VGAVAVTFDGAGIFPMVLGQFLVMICIVLPLILTTV
jgi:hypothetical protein